MELDPGPSLGAHPLPDGSSRFRVWAPQAVQVEVGHLRRSGGGDGREALILQHYGSEPARIPNPAPDRRYEKQLDSADAIWAGPGSPAPQTLTRADATIDLSPESLVLYTG